MAESASSSSPPEPYIGRNCAILNVLPDRFPKTLKDFELDDFELDDIERRNQKRSKKITVHIPTTRGVRNSNFFAHIGMKIQFQSDLAEPGPDSRHVYVVCSPHLGLPGSFKHWSLYTQGHFYHLTTGNPASCLVESAASTSKKIGGSKTILNHQDLSSENTSDYMKYDVERRKIALIAYQVGRTHYTCDEICTLAGWVIKHMPIYKRFSDNCQAFIRSLLYRTVMTKRDFATFVGNGLQLVKWDTARSTSTGQSGNGHQSCIQNGFEISNGVAEVSGLLSFIANLVTDRAEAVSVPVRKLYRQGPRAIGAHDPNGHSSQVSHVLRKFAADLAESRQISKRVAREIYEDCRDRKWKDVLRGRRETAKMFYDLAVERKKQGDPFTAFEIWWYEVRFGPEPSVAQDVSQAVERDVAV